MNLLLLLDKATTDLAAYDAREKVAPVAAKGGLTVVTTSDAVRRYQASIGGEIRGARWRGWVDHCVAGYTAFARVGDGTIGKINAEIGEGALRAGKLVILIGDAGVQRVRSVEHVDSESWVAGWRLVV